ncbi:hypothetical protein FGF77_24310, partial [Salmonella sp. gx-f7]|nr:hypothetical protein [Salmonella sp. gx-f7]
ANNGVRSLDHTTVSTITSHKAGYIDKENELIVGLQTDELLRRAIPRIRMIPSIRFCATAQTVKTISQVTPSSITRHISG